MPLWLTAIAGFEIAGGAAGAVALLKDAMPWLLDMLRGGSVPLVTYHAGTFRFPGVGVALWLIVLFACLASIASGVLILLRQPLGLIMSAALMLLQIPRVTSQCFQYRFSIGAAVYGELRWPDLESWLYGSLGSDYHIHFACTGEPLVLGLNFLSLACVILLFPYDSRRYATEPT